ncbi:hypothetical protein BW723_15975 [Polaribacter reichenbachii]|uniref:Uncharacterized protein n=1 Tax=Polaribacter reichenbachii TaxID=996801 RepID=A0A1B8U2X1_9FLAO|nr:hypothetical protein [Polaribacter reichenbachii]APZ47698.1 hypothetical protein BW723_15975 [Polaribacter reichenbachii]AUC18337.1 hypothetical protein BTO17_06415 [Polaribacter reichenbachii]OBY66233.1 hypothetical protein LPB301_06960 [Polaribacter reichenbachii]
MSKRGSKSTIKLNNAKSISGGSGKGVANWIKKKKKIIKLNPNENQIQELEKHNIKLVDTDLIDNDSVLRSEIVKKTNELISISKIELEPHKLNLEKKKSTELKRILNILQNNILKSI